MPDTFLTEVGILGIESGNRVLCQCLCHNPGEIVCREQDGSQLRCVSVLSAISATVASFFILSSMDPELNKIPLSCYVRTLQNTAEPGTRPHLSLHINIDIHLPGEPTWRYYILRPFRVFVSFLMRFLFIESNQ